MDDRDRWEIVSGIAGNRIRRAPVPGGWLYQAESVQRSRTISEDFPSYEIVRAGWGSPVFVAADRSIAAIDRHDRHGTVADDSSSRTIASIRTDIRGIRRVARSAILFVRLMMRRISGALRSCRSAMIRAIRRALPPE